MPPKKERLLVSGCEPCILDRHIPIHIHRESAMSSPPTRMKTVGCLPVIKTHPIFRTVQRLSVFMRLDVVVKCSRILVFNFFLEWRGSLGGGVGGGLLSFTGKIKNFFWVGVGLRLYSHPRHTPLRGGSEAGRLAQSLTESQLNTLLLSYFIQCPLCKVISALCTAYTWIV